MTSTFRFRRYREEVALRSTQGKPKDDDKNEVPANDKKHDKSPRTKPSSDSENDDTNGTVIQNLCHTIIVVAACGKVFTEEKSKTNDQGDNYKNVSTESSKRDFTKGREPICVVPEGTTLLLRNLKDCHVTMYVNDKTIRLEKRLQIFEYIQEDRQSCIGWLLSHPHSLFFWSIRHQPLAASRGALCRNRDYRNPIFQPRNGGWECPRQHDDSHDGLLWKILAPTRNTRSAVADSQGHWTECGNDENDDDESKSRKFFGSS